MGHRSDPAPAREPERGCLVAQVSGCIRLRIGTAPGRELERQQTDSGDVSGALSVVDCASRFAIAVPLVAMASLAVLVGIFSRLFVSLVLLQERLFDSTIGRLKIKAEHRRM